MRRLLPDLFHITEAMTWNGANDGVFDESTRGASREVVGYIHASFAWQVERVANCVYADNALPLVLLRIDPVRLNVPIRVETTDDDAERFPHIFGPVPLDAVVEVLPFERIDGVYVLPVPLDYEEAPRPAH